MYTAGVEFPEIACNKVRRQSAQGSKTRGRAREILHCFFSFFLTLCPLSYALFLMVMKDFNLHSIHRPLRVRSRPATEDGGLQRTPSHSSGGASGPLCWRWPGTHVSSSWSPCGSSTWLVGELKEALMLLGFVFVIMGITIYRTARPSGLEALRDLTSPRALVIRDGEQKRIPDGK